MKPEFDTSAARAAIFNRIRAAQRRPATATAEELAAVEDYLARHPQGPRPAIEGDLRIRFRAMSERMSSTVDEVAHLADAPVAVARYLAAQGLAPRAVIWPTLASLDWAGAGVEVEARPPRRDESQGADLVGITGCFCALAETGTLVLACGPQAHASTHLLPETHIAVLPASRIVHGMEDAFALLRDERGGDGMLPRTLNMVSGPSRTADIEMTLVLGAHGPYRVHIVLATED
ncbi:MAG: lactate utilization protein C [Burkholderiales bacterium]|nr:MAG: lactate utilization protein C [Burkholderiales bacterium]